MLFANRILLVLVAAVAAPLSQAAMLVAVPEFIHTDFKYEKTQEQIGFEFFGPAPATTLSFTRFEIIITNNPDDTSATRIRIDTSDSLSQALDLTHGTLLLDMGIALADDSSRIEIQFQQFARSSSGSFSSDDEDDDDEDDFEDHHDDDHNDDDSVVPSPGVLTLLPAAGVFALRRRRR